MTAAKAVPNSVLFVLGALASIIAAVLLFARGLRLFSAFEDIGPAFASLMFGPLVNTLLLIGSGLALVGIGVAAREIRTHRSPIAVSAAAAVGGVAIIVFLGLYVFIRP